MAKPAQKPKHAGSKAAKQVVKDDYTFYWLAAGLLLVLIVYFSSLFNGITNWDDNIYTGNPYIRDLSPAGISKIFSAYLLGNYHPLTLLSLGFDHLLGGESPFLYHFTNLAIHLLNTFLVFLLVKRLTGNNLLAIFTSMLFGVHPLHVESVAWISERKDVLYSFFFLVALIFYTEHASGRKGMYYWLSLVFLLLSALAKGQAVVLFAILPLVDYAKGRKWLSGKVLAEKIPFLVLSLIFAWVAFRAQASISAVRTEDFTLAERVAFASFGFSNYLFKSVLPIGLSADYPYPLRSLSGGIPAVYWLFILLLPVFGTGFYFLIRRSKLYAFGAGMFLLSLFPLLQLIPVGGAIMADRYFYIPSVGLLLCFALGLMEIRSSQVRNVVFFLAMLVFSGLTYARCHVWKDSLTLWDDVISKYDYDRNAFTNRGMAYGDLKQWDKAIADYSRAVEIDPKNTRGWFDRGVAYGNIGETDKAISDYTRAIEIDPGFKKGYSNRGMAYMKLNLLDKSMADFSKAIEIDHDYAAAWYNRGLVYSKLGAWEKGIADYTQTLAIDPGFAKAHCNRGMIYSQLGRAGDAINDFTAAIQIDPGYAKAYFYRGAAYEMLGQAEKARADYASAREIDPNLTKGNHDH